MYICPATTEMVFLSNWEVLFSEIFQNSAFRDSGEVIVAIGKGRWANSFHSLSSLNICSLGLKTLFPQ
jgi:hypothetical protein